MRLSVRLDSARAQAQLRRWGGEFRQAAHQAVARALRAEAPEIRDAVRSHVASRLTVVRPSFAKGFTAKVLAEDPQRLPALYVGSRIPWAGMHESGGSIPGRMLIPLYGRVGRKTFKTLVAALLRGRHAYLMRNARGNTLLMAQNTPENARLLAGFKRRYRRAEGIARLGRDVDIPVAVLVSQVRLAKRLDIEGLVLDRVPRLALAIEQQLGALD